MYPLKNHHQLFISNYKQHQHISHHPSSWKGFKIVGDNLDKTVRPRQQKFDKCTKSLHYFNSMAILDRVDMSKLSDERSAFNYSSFSLESLLPQPEDLAEITANFRVLIGRVLVKHVPALKCLNSVVKQHMNTSTTKRCQASPLW